jgi:hypothetical protein
MAVRVAGGTADLGRWYLVIPAALGIAGLAIATILARHDDWLAAATATGVTGLLVSPISWTHHWVWVLPALVLLMQGGRAARISAGFGYLLFVFAPMWFTARHGGPQEYGFHGPATLVANCYLEAALIFLGYLGWRAWLLLRPAGEATVAGPHRAARWSLPPAAPAQPGRQSENRQADRQQQRRPAERAGQEVAAHLGDAVVIRDDHRHEQQVAAGDVGGNMHEQGRPAVIVPPGGRSPALLQASRCAPALRQQASRQDRHQQQVAGHDRYQVRPDQMRGHDSALQQEMPAANEKVPAEPEPQCE